MDHLTKLERKVVRVCFNNNPDNLHKALWRMTHGNRARAIEMMRNHAEHYGIPKAELTDMVFDTACAALTEGVEVEWVS